MLGFVGLGLGLELRLGLGLLCRVRAIALRSVQIDRLVVVASLGCIAILRMNK